MKIIVTLVVLCSPVSAFAQQEMQIRNEPSPAVVIPDIPDREGFWKQFSVSLEERGPLLFESRLHPSQEIGRLIRFQDSVGGYRDSIDHAALGALSKTVNYSARETFLATPLMVWLDGRRDIVSEFLRSSIGDTDEEEIEPHELSYSAVEQKWWKRVANSRFRRGVHMFRKNPYAFASIGLGDKTRPPVILHGRYQLNDWNHHRMELVSVVETLPGVRLEVGTLYHPQKENEIPGFTMKIYRRLGKRAAAFAGLDVSRENQFVFGMNSLW